MCFFFCHLLVSSSRTITVSLRYGIAGAYKHLWPRKGQVKFGGISMADYKQTELQYLAD